MDWLQQTAMGKQNTLRLNPSDPGSTEAHEAGEGGLTEGSGGTDTGIGAGETAEDGEDGFNNDDTPLTWAEVRFVCPVPPVLLICALASRVRWMWSPCPRSGGAFDTCDCQVSAACLWLLSPGRGTLSARRCRKGILLFEHPYRTIITTGTSARCVTTVVQNDKWVNGHGRIYQACLHPLCSCG